MIVYVMVRLGVDVGNLGAISAQSRRDLGAIWARSGRIGCASGWKFVFNDGGLGVGGMLERGFISGSRDSKSRSDCGTCERRGHSGEMVSALRHSSTEVFACLLRSTLIRKHTSNGECQIMRNVQEGHGNAVWWWRRFSKSSRNLVPSCQNCFPLVIFL